MGKPLSREGRVVTEEMLQNLPEPVRRYMDFAGVVGKAWIHTACVEQAGRFRQAADRPWMPMDAVQTFTTDPPGFVWKARAKVAGLLLISVRDSYQDGHGQMFGRLAGLFTIFDAHGEGIAQGSMMRYLGEMIWFPTAYLGENVAWQAVDDNSAEVTFTDFGRSVSARLTFDESGRPTNFFGLRSRETDGVYSLAPWSVPIREYGVRCGLTIPTRGQVTWNLPSGDLPYYDWEVGEVGYNGR